MKSFIEQAQNYAAYQHNATTRYIHMISIPLIILSFMILLGFIRVIVLGVLNIDFAEIATIGLLIYYFRLHWRLALALTPLFLFLLWVAEYISYSGPTEFALWAFVLPLLFGGMLQFIGYFLEGSRPSINNLLEQMLIAPLSMIADVIFLAGWMPALKNEIYGGAIVDAQNKII